MMKTYDRFADMKYLEQLTFTRMQYAYFSVYATFLLDLNGIVWGCK